jgi:hypothetical protein
MVFVVNEQSGCDLCSAHVVGNSLARYARNIRDGRHSTRLSTISSVLAPRRCPSPRSVSVAAGVELKPMTPSPRLDVVRLLRNEFDQPPILLDWWRQAFEKLDEPTVHELVLSLVRQSGKSQFLAAAAWSNLLTQRDSYVLFVSASERQATAIFNRKISKPFAAVSRALRLPANSLVLTRRGVDVPDLGSTLETVAPNEATAPGRSPSCSWSTKRETSRERRLQR